MDCNRDEAKRAKEIAEKKFSAKDITGAKKFALKAQSLYPDLDGIFQFLAVLDVYVAAENKVNGELDFYAILGVSPLARDDTVKKHYRKLALSLHPDKNKSVGADEAFKYVSEAWNVLSDKDKRSTYDQKRNGHVFVHVRTQNGNSRTQNGGSRTPNGGSRAQNGGSRAQNGGDSGPPKFSGKNGFCKFTKGTTSQAEDSTTRAKDTTPKAKSTTPKAKSTTSKAKGKTSQETNGKTTKAKGTTPKAKSTPTKEEDATTQEKGKTSQEEDAIPQTNGTTPKAKGTTAKAEDSIPQEEGKSSQEEDTTTRTNGETPKAKGKTTKVKGTTPKAEGSKTTKTIVKSSLGKQIERKTFWTVCRRCKLQYEFLRKYLNRNLICPTCYGPFLAAETVPPNTIISSQVPEMIQGVGPVDNNTKTDVSQPVLKPVNGKSKRKREESEAPISSLKRKIPKKGAKTKQDVNGFEEKKETEPVAGPTPVSSGQVEMNKDRIKNQLIKIATMEIRKKLNQWSSENVVRNNKDLDDDNDRVESVPDPDFHDFDQERLEKCFKEGQVWAAYDDHDGMPRYYSLIKKVISLKPFKMKVCWLNSKPLGPPSETLKAFGEFTVGKHETVTVPNYFSHKANFTKQESGTIRVFPKKGDVCAMFGNEIVEVDEYDEETGITTVTPLIKVADFKAVFHRHINPNETRAVPENEMFRFSHKIPSFLLTGKESPNAPKGCLELDPAAIPPEFLRVTVKKDDDDEMLEKDSKEIDDPSVDGVSPT